MVVIKYATYFQICPFTRTLISPKNRICLFNEEQLEAFKKIVGKALPSLFPELIDIIIEKTKYPTLLHLFGHADYTHWSKKYKAKDNLYSQNYIIEFAKLTDTINHLDDTDDTEDTDDADTDDTEDTDDADTDGADTEDTDDT